MTGSFTQVDRTLALCTNRLGRTLFVSACLLVSWASHASATVLPYAQVVSGTISSAAQTDTYTFNANSNDVIDFTIVITSGNMIPKIRVLNPDGSQLTGLYAGSPFGCSGSTLELNNVTLPSTGAYTVYVNDCADTNTGSFLIYAQRTNNPTGPAGLGFGGVPQAGSITSAAQSNTYTFRANANDVIDFTMVVTSGTVVPKIRLYNPSGSEVTGLYSGSPFGCSGSTLELNTVTLPATGTYTVLFGDCADTNTGSYLIFAQRTNNATGSVPLTLGGTPQEGSITSAAQSNAYVFDATAGAVLSLTMVANGIVPKIRVYGPGGSQVTALYAGSPFGCSGSSLEINNVTLSTTGAYTILLGDCSDLNSGTYSLSALCVGAGTCTTPNPVMTSTALGFFPITPCRIVDTRTTQNKMGSYGPPSLTTGGIRDFPLTSSACGLPGSAQAFSLNFTVVPSGPLPYLSVWPTGQSYPGVSTLNSTDASTLANAAIVPSGTNGSITTLSGGNTDLIIDTNGYFALPNGSDLAFYPVTPCRVADTRSSQPFSGAFGPPSLFSGEQRDFPIQTSNCDIPASAAAYSLNLTAVPEGPLPYLSAWPTGQPYPDVSTLNSNDGSIIANTAIVPAGSPSGSIRVLSGGNTDLIIDINGYFGPSGGPGALHFYTLTPCRVADTRASQGFGGAFGPPSMAASTSRDFPILSSACSVPNTAKAYSLNITAVPQGGLPYLSIWPAGQGYPNVSTLNSPKGTVLANAAIVPAGSPNGGITILTGSATDVIIDINGYFAP